MENTGMNRWEGRVALVTGASSGIGQAVAEKLASCGLKVAGCARRMDRLESLATKITKSGGQFMPIQTDLQNPDEILQMFEHLRQQWNGVDVLVNNAGLGHKAPLLTGETDQWKEMLDVNVLALLICSREAVKDMQKNGDNGHVIHISSMSGHRVPPGGGVYSATKFSVRALTEALRHELRHASSQIRVTAISPGFVETEFAEKFNESQEVAKETYGRFPVLQSSDIAEAVTYALAQPPHAQIHDILIRPTQQPS